MPRFKFCPLCAAPLVERTVQREVRSACSAQCGFIHYDNPTPVVAAVVEHDGIIAYHVPTNGTISLNDELDDFRHVPLQECKVWSSGTGFALRDWLRSRGIEPPMLELPKKNRSE